MSKKLGSVLTDKSNIAMILAGYAKRLLENKYSSFFDTAIGQQLKEINQPGKLSIEFLLNSLSAVIEKKLPEETILKKLVKEVLIDAPPELSKRILNHDEVNQEVKSLGVKSLIASFLGLQKAELGQLIKWLSALSRTERSAILKELSKLSAKELRRLLSLSGEQRQALFALFQARPPKKNGLGKRLNANLTAMNTHLRDYIARNTKPKEES